MRVARALALLGVVAAGQLACGDDGLPQCPTGSCVLPGSTIIKWRFNHYPELLFDSDTCSDLGAISVRVEITHVDDPAVTDMMEKACGEGQLTFLDLPAGTYNVALTPLDFDGNSLVNAPVQGQGLAGSAGANNEIAIDVPHTAWVRTYTGQFLFRLSWGGMSCDLATPAVVRQKLTLTAGGQAVTQVTDTGQLLDGNDAQPCRALTEQFPQFVQGLPFGPATLLVVGTSANPTDVLFEREFATFVGAGMFNPTITFDVPPPDAGVDAPPDAM